MGSTNNWKMIETPPRKALEKNSFIIPMTPAMNQLGYGTGVNVWEFKNAGQTSPWAVKNVRRVMKEEFKKQYQTMIDREGSVLKEMNHENIIGFRGFLDSNDGRRCLAMEKCDDCLGMLIEEREEEEFGPFPPHEIVKVIQSVAKALDYLHTSKNLLHGDVKSYNILIKGDFQTIKLCDFGASVTMKHGVAESYIGTTVYNAPEVVNEVGPFTVKADIFSLGLVIWEMLTLKPPHFENFEDTMGPDTDASVIVLNDSYVSAIDTAGTRPPLPDNLSEEYEDLIKIFNVCTEADQNLRPTAKELLNML